MRKMCVLLLLSGCSLGAEVSGASFNFSVFQLEDEPKKALRYEYITEGSEETKTLFERAMQSTFAK